MSYRDLPPVANEKRPPLPATLRQTLLATFDACPRAGMLSLQYNGGAASHAQARGTAFHTVVQLATLQLIVQNEKRYPPQMIKGLLNDVLAEHSELVVPAGEMDGLRAMLWNWASHFTLPDGQVMVEQPVMLEFDGTICTGVVDLIHREGNRMVVTDYKTSQWIPAQEEFEAQFQLPFYALAVASGRIACLNCNPERKKAPRGCEYCRHGWIHNLARDVELFALRQVYPRYANDDGMACREVLFTREQILDHAEYVSGLVRRTVDRFTTGLFPAIPGSHCAICPASQECPLPKVLRKVETFSPFERDPAEIAEEWFFLQADAKRLKESLREYAKVTDRPIAFGADLELGFTVTESIRDGKLVRSSRFDTRKRR